MQRFARVLRVRGLIAAATGGVILAACFHATALTQAPAAGNPGSAGQPNATTQAAGTPAPQAAPSQSASTAPSSGQSATSAAKADATAAFRPRLPMYYAKVVDDKQRQSIYDIQRKYHPQIADLQRQLEKLIAQRDAEIEAVLTPQQKAEVEKLRKEAAARRGGKATAEDSSDRTPSQ
ncbi:MAG: hypothetical protein Kow0040_31600 [Thermogutta sp.]